MLLTDVKDFDFKWINIEIICFYFYKQQISYTPNIARSGQTSLRLDMWDSESESIFLPITYTAQIANLEIKPPEIIIGFCFINLPYTQNISIENKSNIEAYFYVLPQTVSILQKFNMKIDIDF